MSGAQQHRLDTPIEVAGAVVGTYLEFVSQPGSRLDLQSLENKKKGIELLAVTQANPGSPRGAAIETATIFIPEGAEDHLKDRIVKYSDPKPKAAGERRFEKMLDPVSALRLAALRGLWTDTEGDYPAAQEAIWWEVWLRRADGRELERLHDFAGQLGLSLSSKRLEFEERIVTLVHATAEQLSLSLAVLGDFAELRRAKEAVAFFQCLPPREQVEWTNDLIARCEPPPDGAPAVCLLDTGVTQAHPLLELGLLPEDTHACEQGWGTHDHTGHGTEMAGLALYGDIAAILEDSGPVWLRHGLESVKILPPPPKSNPPEIYGAITAMGTSCVEISQPWRKRCYSMAVTATDTRDRGQPTSWSAAVDALAAGRSFDPATQGLIYLPPQEGWEPRRLFLISAGNVIERDADHLDRSDVEPVHDPAQAWNAVTVGSSTDRIAVNDPDWLGWRGLARVGELSPWSSTSVPFADQWPIKPEVVFEGGNVATNDAEDFANFCPDLTLLTTHYKPLERLFTTSCATSASTAQVARLAALIQADYPDYWPETVRGLIIHSARWTPAMQIRLESERTKGARARLLRRYGYGVPDPARALRSASDALTLIRQGTIHPFSKSTLNEMHVYELPWPTAVLEQLGETQVGLRVTLSYFIEPNPARRGWRERYRYASHGLRFEVKGPTETITEFRKRINKLALEQGERKPKTGPNTSEWYLGPKVRDKGSIHCDWIEKCSAAQISQRGVIAIYPVAGWWKNQPARDRSELGARYSLIVSIESDAISMDIWSPVAVQVAIPVEIQP